MITVVHECVIHAVFVEFCLVSSREQVVNILKTVRTKEKMKRGK